MPHPRDDLGDGGVAQVEMLNEGYNIRSVVGSPGVLVTSFG